MRLVTFLNGAGEQLLGVVLNTDILDLYAASEGKLPRDILAFIAAGPAALSLAKEIMAYRAQERFLIPLEDTHLRAPLPQPASLRDFFAFEEHAKAGSARRQEAMPREWYEVPAYYKGNHREIYGPNDEIPWPFYTRRLDFECEIACVIGRQGRNISLEQAQDYIFGYMIFNDFSARDIQKKEMVLRMGPAKGKDFANAFGPYLVTADEVDPIHDFSMTIKVNGETWSQGHFKDQYWGFPLLVSHVSQEETVYPGDILGSGTFYKGCGLDLDRWIKPGDVLELEVPKLGILKNIIGTPRNQRELNYQKYPASGINTHVINR